MKQLPCFTCETECGAYHWLNLAYELGISGIEVGKVTLPCPKNNCTYTWERVVSGVTSPISEEKNELHKRNRI